MAMHEDRNRSDLVVQAFDIYGSEEPRPGQRYAYEAVLRLPRGRHRAIVAAYDTLISPILAFPLQQGGKGRFTFETRGP